MAIARREESKGISETKLSPIENVFSDLHHSVISRYLSGKELHLFSQTSNAMFTQCRVPLVGRKLLSHVVKAEEALALSMISANPSLLLHSSEAIDYSNRLYTRCTPFQAALLCHDVMLWQKIEPFFDELPDGQAEKAKQWNALFPEGLPTGTPFDFSSLIHTMTHSSVADISAALKKTQNDTEICQALNQFRSDFTALAMQETFFNSLHVLTSFMLYVEQFENWSWNQRSLFMQQVIGYTQRFAPACYAQLLIQGGKHQPLSRELKFKHDTGSYFPVLDSLGLGFDFGWIIAMGSIAMVGPKMKIHAATGDESFLAWTNYVAQIQQELFKLEQRVKCIGEPITGRAP